MLLSFVLAFFFWAVAIESEDPTRVDSYGATIPVEFRGLPETMTTYGLNGARVKVDIRAPESVWAGLGADDIEAYIDLSEVPTGTQRVPVIVDLRAQPADVQAVNPDVVELVVETIAEREVAVVVRVQGTPEMGYSADPPEVAPQSLRIRGAASLVERADHAELSVSVEGRQNSLRGDFDAEIIDIDGEPVPELTVMPKSVTVNVPVEPLGFIRDIPVTLGPLPGQPATGYRLANIEFEPPVVKVFGRTELVESVNYLQTEPISLEGITQTLTARVNLQGLEGLSMIEPPTPNVTVTVTVEVIRSGLTLELTPTFRGLSDGVRATVGPDSIVTIISGPLAVMEALDTSQVEMVLDLTGLGPGEYVLTPVVNVPAEVDIENIIPEAVPVTIEEQIEIVPDFR